MTRPGRLLQIDLSSGTGTVREIPVTLMETYLGGRGLALRLLRPTYNLAPDDPAQVVIFAPGALCGRGVPTADRLSVAFRSPLTGRICHNSDGGPFALALRRAGLDALAISGSAPTRSILKIDGTSVELLAATDWCGAPADETIAALATEYAAAVVAIGPAGETGVRFAALHFGDGNLCGRGGLGAVLGGKGLKAIAIVHPEEVLPEPSTQLAAAAEDVLRLFRASPVLLGPLGFATFGTAALVDLAARRGLLPAHNFRSTLSPAAAAVFSGPALRKTIEASGFGCGSCPLACKRRDAAGSPQPEFETLAAFGGLADNLDLPTILAANRQCNQLGLDPVSAAALLALRAEVCGEPLTAAEIPPLLAEIARRNGEGAELADGALRYARLHRVPELAMVAKGLELPPLDPRSSFGYALAACVSPSGDPCGAMTLGVELLRKPVPVERLTFERKGRLVRLGEDTVAAVDSLGICRHALLGAGLEEFAALVAAAIGRPTTAGALLAIGEQVHLLERALDQQSGVIAADDTLPQRFFQSTGGPQGVPGLDRPRLEEEVVRYRRIRQLAPDGRLPLGWLEVAL